MSKVGGNALKTKKPYISVGLSILLP